MTREGEKENNRIHQQEKHAKLCYDHLQALTEGAFDPIFSADMILISASPRHPHRVRRKENVENENWFKGMGETEYDKESKIGFDAVRSYKLFSLNFHCETAFLLKQALIFQNFRHNVPLW